jgi:hypothetical protein
LRGIIQLQRLTFQEIEKYEVEEILRETFTANLNVPTKLSEGLGSPDVANSPNSLKPEYFVLRWNEIFMT